MDEFIEGQNLEKFRILILGSSRVGKTTLINQYINNFFKEIYYPTKDIVSYKMRYNFNPNSDEIDEYIYVEILDSISIDRGNHLQGIF